MTAPIPSAQEEKTAASALEAALTRFADAKPDPVFVAAFDTLKKGAPGLSESTCEALARSIAIKVAYAAKATGATS